MPYEILLQGLDDVLQSQKIADSTSQDIAKMLVKIFLLVGLRQKDYPTKEEQVFIEAYIRKNYFHKTTEEFVLAFDLAIKNQLECDAKVYDQFTIEYMVRIMEAYKKWLRLNYIPKKQEPMQIEYKISREEKIEEIEEWKKKDSINLFLIPVFLYEWMKELEYINPTNAEKKEVFEKAKDIYKKRLQDEAIEIGTFRKVNQFLEFNESDKNIVVNLSKKLIVFNYLKSK